MVVADKPKLALILGSGFSKEAGLPTTRELSSHFLEDPRHGILGTDLEREVSNILRTFWQYVFGYQCGGNMPSLEDHFTVLDLAANSGHHLGRNYSPKKLRAIRRISIHRVFQILDLEYNPGDAVQRFLPRLCDKFDISIVTLNWDIVAEKILQERGVRYGITIGPLEDSFEKKRTGVLLLKVHGSSNWVYCDSCRRLFAGAEKSALYRKTFLEKEDFILLGVSELLTQHGLGTNNERSCRHCGNSMSGRVATFSYRKAFSINQFQTIWDRAHEALSEADTWLFVGYSMPQADFEFRHLLKSAQLGRNRTEQWQCRVIIKDDEEAGNRYREFFGIDSGAIHQEGLARWVDCNLDAFCEDRGTADDSQRM